MATFKVWQDDKAWITVHAEDKSAALDIAAKEFGYTNYSDMAEALKLDSSKKEGLNIEEIL